MQGYDKYSFHQGMGSSISWVLAPTRLPSVLITTNPSNMGVAYIQKWTHKMMMVKYYYPEVSLGSLCYLLLCGVRQ